MSFKKPRYKVYDGYEGAELLGKCDTLDEVRAIAKERNDDTDGECFIYAKELNEETGEYTLCGLR